MSSISLGLIQSNTSQHGHRQNHNNTDPLLPIFFKSIEEKIQNQIDSGNTIFFSQLINNLEEKTYDTIHKYISNQKRRIEEIEFGFFQYPCILSLYVTVTISRNIGDQFKIYPYLENAFNIEFNTDIKKKKFWLSFRNACKKIGLEVSPRTSGTHFMVNEYLRQCGFPLKNTDIFVKRCLLLGNQVGFPDKDDTESLRIWHEDLLRSFNVNFPKTALRILENDFESYYIQNFLEVFEDTADQTKFNQFQIKVAEYLNAEQNIQKHTSKALDIPRLIFQDGLIGIRLNNPNNTDWSIVTDNSLTCNIDCTSFVPFDSLLAKSVVITNYKYKREWVFNLWQDDKSNRMLLFQGTDGRFVSPVSFSTEETPLTPGKYILLTKFSPNHPELPSILIHDAPEVFETRFSIAPGQQLQINRGPAVLGFKADASPLLDFSGDKRSDLEGQEVFTAKNLQLNLQLPPDCEDKELTLRIRSKTLGPAIDIHIDAATSQKFCIDLAGHFAEWSPGVTRIVAECRKPSSQRILARTSAVIWNGLQDIEQSGIITCSDNPTNFDKEKSKNFSQDEQAKTLSIKEFLNKTWSTVFNDGGTALKFVWGRPGLTLRLRTVENGNLIERSIPEGSKISIQSGTNDLLMIFGLGEGIIRLGEETWRITQNQKHWKAPLLSLIDRIDVSNNILSFESSLGTTKELLHFVTPHNAESVKLDPSWKGYTFSFTQAENIEGLWLQATNLITGEISSFYFDTMYSWSMLEHFTSGGEVSVEVSGPECTITFSPIEWPDGLWKVEINTRSKNRWGKITNARLDEHSIVMPIEDENFLDNPTQPIFSMAQKHDESLHEIILAVHKHLLSCHSMETWPHMEWMKALWHQLMAVLVHDIDQNWDKMRTVMQVLDTEVPEDAHPGWVPLVHTAWNHPKFFSFPSTLYAKYGPEKKHLALCVHNLILFEDIIRSMSKGDLHPSTGLPIKDKVQCKGFEISHLIQFWSCMDFEDERKVLRYPNWRPGLGHYLGPLHLRYAQMSLKDTYSRTQIGQGNSQRRSGCIKIAQRAINCLSLPNAQLGADHKTWIKFFEYGLDGDDENENEILCGSKIFLATVAHICRKSAHFDINPKYEIKCYVDRLIPSDDEKIIATLGAEYLIACGEELFGFYLMFWELLFQTGLDA